MDRERAQIYGKIEKALRGALSSLRAEISASGHSTSVAVFRRLPLGRTLFARCRGPRGGAGIAMHRVLLPQPLDAYLTAGDRLGPNFDPAGRDEALRLLGQPHVVHVQSVSNAADCNERFVDASRALLDACDVAVCLVRAGQIGQPIGTVQFAENARKMGRPLRIFEVALVAHGDPVVTARLWEGLEHFVRPELPSWLEAVPLRLSGLDG